MAMPDLQRYPLKDLSDQLSGRYCHFSSWKVLNSNKSKDAFHVKSQEKNNYFSKL